MKTILAAVAIATLAVSASAEENRATVQYRDLDLSTKAGQKALDQRIEKAAKVACEFEDVSTGSRLRTNETRECLKQAKRQIERQLATIVDTTEKGG
ncbi:UrcA family protein [Qipengyuania sphaerica]|uniref:UrcA family protein n=1 Tax=Qipengyuania sphaerica TaxID=2867243 RepID=UPI001C867947|nr:UrcA family protein [Qipengyuania sphaerica]MBX7541547.1 UrcA family protein [Qipengyuania sphaerica]